jgi:hypothetical protein
MGNTLPITAQPKPSASRAVLLLEQKCVRSYLREPCRQPVGQLQIVGFADELPPALDGVVPFVDYKEMTSFIGTRVSNFKGDTAGLHFLPTHRSYARGTPDSYKIRALSLTFSIFTGGQIAVCVAIFQGLILLSILIGFIFSKFIMGNRPFLNPVSLGILVTLEFVILMSSGRYFQKEERKLTEGLLSLLHPWREKYEIVAKIRKTKGKNSSTIYCIVLEKLESEHDVDTASMSTCVDIDTDVESQV